MEAQAEIAWIPILRRPGAPVLFNSYIAVGQTAKYFGKALGMDFEFRNYGYIDGDILFTGPELGAIRGIVAANVPQPDYLNEKAKRCYEESEKLLEISSQIAELKDLGSLSNKELKDWFDKYSEQVLKTIPFLNYIVVVEMVLQEELGKRIEEPLSRSGKEELLDQYLKDLISPPMDANPALAVIELTEIAASIQENPEIVRLFEGPVPEIKELLEKEHPALLNRLTAYIDKYAWMGTYHYRGSPTTLDDVIADLKVSLKKDCAKQLGFIREESRDRERIFESIAEELELSEETLGVIKVGRENLYLRQYRHDVLLMAGSRVRGLLTGIAQRLNTDYLSLNYLTFQEISEAIEEGQIPEKVNFKERKRDFAFFFEDGKLRIITSKDLAEERAARAVVIERVPELTGFVAFAGKYVGRVKIVDLLEEIAKMEAGDVLVAAMTNPYYVPAMIRAGAIVTDEGGILSHAAIVSRELGIPCIIGTDKATKVFKDNDLIEVDATGIRGVVRLVRAA